MQLSWPYRDVGKTPFWGTPSSNSNFCEEDYIITEYIGEFINTLTSVCYVFYAYHGLQRQRKGPKPAPMSIQLPYYGLGLVGILSALFHAVLNYHSQMGDDLSMHFATTFIFYRAMTFDKSEAYRRNFGILISSILIPFLVWHCVTDEVIMHQVVWGIMLVMVAVKARDLYGRVKDEDMRKRVNYLSWFGRISFITGYALWQVDERICPTVTRFKRHIGLPWAFLFELHGWWHILTSIGAYTFMALIEYLTSGEPGGTTTGDFAWPVGDLLSPVKRE